MLNILIEVLSCFVDIVISMWFITYLNGHGMKNNKPFYVVSISLLTVGLLMRMMIHSIFSVLIYYIVIVFGLLAYSLLCFPDSKIYKRIILPLSFSFYYTFSKFLACFIVALLFHDSIFEALYAVSVEKIVLEIIYILLLCSAVFVSFLLYRQSFRLKNNINLLYWLIPFPAILSGNLFFIPVILIHINQESLGIFLVFIEIISMISTICIYYLLFKIWSQSMVEKEKELYKSMLKMERKRYLDIQKTSNRINKIKHDIKNMLFAVKSELDLHNTDRAQEKLSDILDGVSSIGTIIASNNRTLDCIVNSKLGDVDGCEISVSGDASGMNHLRDVDVSVILGNILDNALEAVKDIDHARIDLSFFIKNNYQNIICKNTVRQSVLESNPNLNTQKSGIGIKSIKESVKLYNGLIAFFEENDFFCVHIMTPISTS